MLRKKLVGMIIAIAMIGTFVLTPLAASANHNPDHGSGNQGLGRVCQIAYLDIEEGLFLDVLGLEVDLERVVLDVDAVGGPGNLVGNLLCAITGLLDSPGSGAVNAINQLFDRVVGILEGLGLIELPV